MLKKRLIFTLLYDEGNFMLSRNFRLQKVGDYEWLKTNYDFSKISFEIDELIILDVTRNNRDSTKFCSTLSRLSETCFIPYSVGGGIRTVEDAMKLINAGADKIVLNTSLIRNVELVNELSKLYGEQCLVASVDLKCGIDGNYKVVIESGTEEVDGEAQNVLRQIMDLPIGEVMLNSIDKDGTGQGLDMALLTLLPNNLSKPLILTGGVGNASHLAVGFSDAKVDAVNTANLFNFVGDGLRKARKQLISGGHGSPQWDSKLAAELQNCFAI